MAPIRHGSEVYDGAFELYNSTSVNPEPTVHHQTNQVFDGIDTVPLTATAYSLTVLLPNDSAVSVYFSPDDSAVSVLSARTITIVGM